MTTEAEYLTLKDQVFRRLQNDIISNHFKPEQTLNINELCERYQVSRTPIREAVHSLASLGLLSMTNYRSIKVAKFLSDEIREIYYMRAAISGLSARQAAEHMPEEEIRYLRETLEGMRKCFENDEQDGFMEINRAFHLKIEEQIKTGVIRKMSEQFYVITQLYRVLGYEARYAEENLREHRNIVEAIEARDPKKAEEYGRLHYERTMEILEEQNRALR